MRVGHEVVSITAGPISPGVNATWWWNDNVQEVIKAKKEAMKMWETSGRQRATGRQTRKQRKQLHSQGASNERVVRGAGNTGG